MVKCTWLTPGCWGAAWVSRYKVLHSKYAQHSFLKGRDGEIPAAKTPNQTGSGLDGGLFVLLELTRWGLRWGYRRVDWLDVITVCLPCDVYGSI